MDEIIVSAPGKLILHGEHAVVYGKVALATSLNLRSYLRLTSSVDEDNVSLSLPDINIKKTWTTESLQNLFKDVHVDEISQNCLNESLVDVIKEFTEFKDEWTTRDLAIVSFLYMYRCIAVTDGHYPAFNLKIASSLPISAGLGSSAAFSVAMATAFLILTKKLNAENIKHNTTEIIDITENNDDTPSQKKLKLDTEFVKKSSNSVKISSKQDDDHANRNHFSDQDLDLINQWAFISEKIIHGTPSGVDNSLSTNGGFITYQKKLQGVPKIEKLQGVPNIRVLLINSMVPRSTKALVAGVRQKYDKFPSVFGPIMDSIESTSLQSKKILEQLAMTETPELMKSLEELIKINRCLLDAIGVGHKDLDQIYRVLQTHGLPCKLTGAGGGGCAFAILRQDTSEDFLKEITKDLSSHGYQCWETSIGGAGVTIHKKADGQYQNEAQFPKTLFD
ncbi:unnamed protein product [Owenia fusiformis]|uniref:Mevalonate kinase n=1 Tax=Owenia fusiformis TaxID=6347 RepID=A0A8S4Q618_OWEFU|nr:unnamed protein product [Owenia fusiformis]